MATYTATTSGNWSANGTWDVGSPPPDDNTALVVINAGVAVKMDVTQVYGLATGNSLTINSAAAGSTPGCLYWMNGATGKLIIPAGGKIIGTNLANKGRLLANYSGLWTVSSDSSKFVQSQSGTGGTVTDGGGGTRIFTPSVSPSWVTNALSGESMTINGSTYTINSNTATAATLATGPDPGTNVTSWSLVVRPLPVANRATIMLQTTAQVVTQYLDVAMYCAEPTTKGVRTYGQIFDGCTVQPDPTNTLTKTGLSAAIPNGKIVRVSGSLEGTNLSAGIDYWVVGGGGGATIQLSTTYNGSPVLLGSGGPVNVHTGWYANWGISGNTLTKTNHGLTNGVAVMVRSSGTLPTPLAADTLYYVVSSTANAISLALTSGGTALTLGGSPSGTLDVYAGSTGAAPGTGGTNPYTSTMVNVLDDVTGDSAWEPGEGTWASTNLLNAAVLANEGPQTYDIQRLAIAAITASTMTLSEAVNSYQYPNARIWLMSRNASIQSSCGSSTQAVVDATNKVGGIFGEIRVTAGTGTTFYGYGLSSGSYNTVSTVCGCSRGVYNTNYNTVSIVCGCSAGLYSSHYNTVSIVSGCSNGTTSSHYNTVSIVSGCGNGLYGSNYNTVSIVSGCGTGTYGCSGRFRGTVFSGNGTDISLSGSHIEGWGVSLQDVTQVAYYKQSSFDVPDYGEVVVGITDLCDPVTHAILPGNVGWWCPGGFTKTAAWDVGVHGTPPVSLTYVHVSTAEDSDRDFWVEFPVMGKAGKTLTVTVYHKVTTTSGWVTAPRIEICDPNKNWKASGELLASSSAFSIADTAWHTDTASYDVTYDRPLVVRVRGCGGNTGGTGTGQMYWWQVIEVQNTLGQASGPLTLSKETGANARGGSGTCAKLVPSSTNNYGYWYFLVPTTASIPFTLSFYHKIATGFNGSLKCTIYDTDQTTIKNNSETVTLTDDGSYHQFTATPVTPTATGFCLVRIEVEQGTHAIDDAVYIDDIAYA